MATDAQLAAAIAALPEVIANPNILMDNELPLSLADQLVIQGLTVNRTDVKALASVASGVFLVDNSSLVNEIISAKQFDENFDFKFLLLYQEAPRPGDMEEQYLFDRQGRFVFIVPGDEIEYSIYKFERTWIN